MALFHYAAQIISRSAGKSAVAAAAYRAGENLWDERYGKQYDYSRKLGVAHSEILLPPGAPAWMSNRQMLWNQVEAIEKHPRAQLCREFTVALQTELSIEQNLELLRGFLHEQFVSRGLAVDVAVHYPIESDRAGAERCRNPHAHVMYPMRIVKGDSLGNKLRGTAAEHQAELLEERQTWADHVNRALAKAGVATRVDHRSLKEQGVERQPQIHLGVHAYAMEKRGIKTERGELLAAILQHNQDLAAAVQEYPSVETAGESGVPTEGERVGQDQGLELTELGADLPKGEQAKADPLPLQSEAMAAPRASSVARSKSEEPQVVSRDAVNPDQAIPVELKEDPLLPPDSARFGLEVQQEVKQHLEYLRQIKKQIKQQDCFEIDGCYAVTNAAQSTTLRSITDGRILMEQGQLTAQFRQQDLDFLRRLRLRLKERERELKRTQVRPQSKSHERG